MKTLLILLWIGVGAGALVGLVVLLVGFQFTQNGIQEVTIIALSLAAAILPYVGVRAVSEIVNITKE